MSQIKQLLEMYEAYAKAHPSKHIKDAPEDFLTSFHKDTGQGPAEMMANTYEEIYNKSVGVFFCTSDETFYVMFDDRW